MNILVTGGAGFIGSAFIRYVLAKSSHSIINVDKLTYAANLSALQMVQHNPKYTFVQADILDGAKMQQVVARYQPNAFVHFAAESHVDRSIAQPDRFIQTNIVGTYQLLEAARQYWQQLPCDKQAQFRFLHVSTDEVYGALSCDAARWQEGTVYRPSSPYSASKASSDHLVQAWQRTYGLPSLITHCSNNYGPYQYPEKLIPFMIKQALQGKPLPIYGDGQQRRDWLFVDDHVRALYLVLMQGRVGEHYHVSAGCEQANLAVVQAICQQLNQLRQADKLHSFQPALQHIADFQQCICFVQDRAGHDFRYGLNSDKIKNELGWQPLITFEQGLKDTVQWYVDYFASLLSIKKR